MMLPVSMPLARPMPLVMVPMVVLRRVVAHRERRAITYVGRRSTRLDGLSSLRRYRTLTK